MTVASAMDEADVWNLFPNKEALQERMTRQVQQNVETALAQQQAYEQQMEARQSNDDEVTTLGLDPNR